MIGRVHHLNDDRLVECYFEAVTGEDVPPPEIEHLTDCTSCRERYAELTELMEGIRSEADAESDELFTADRLRHQQDQILRRLEHLNRPARIISFPGRVTRHISGNARVAPRWLAAAAAAGLFVGVAVGGMFLQPGLRRSLPVMHVAARPTAVARATPAPAARVANPVPVTDTFDDDVFLQELEFALARPHTRELQPFDALTPHVREIGSQVR